MTENNNFEDIKNKVEAILFSYGEWISINEIMHTLKLDSQVLIKNSLKELKEKYKENYPFGIFNDGDKYKMSLKEEYESIVEELISGTEIPKPVLKVLSVIAYEQPITKTRLSEIIGKPVKEEVNYLFKHKFLSYEKKGIGKYYKVTKKFFDYFKIDDEEFRNKANQNITNFINPLPESLKEAGIEEEEEERKPEIMKPQEEQKTLILKDENKEE